MMFLVKISLARSRMLGRAFSHATSNIGTKQLKVVSSKELKPSFKDFLISSTASQSQDAFIISNRLPKGDPHLAPYLDSLDLQVDKVPVYIRTYGCQMNENDTEIASSILKDYGYQIVDDESKAEIYLLMTCAIRDSAESKIWKKLHHLRTLKSDPNHPLRKIGLLGCMAERLKEKVLNASKLVDIVAGPDAYRDLPKLFAINNLTNRKAVNCLLSFDETYSDISSSNELNKVSSFVSITRGCDNLCSYCIVPFTRGRERSRPLDTILDDVRNLHANGVKEVTLLGQNVNSYRDMSAMIERTPVEQLGYNIAPGFKTIYKPRSGGLTFDVLLEEVAKISPELRIRFTSPHPKDFTDQVIDVMRRYPNIAKCVHLPAQSGNNSMLERMRRGYTREAYLSLVSRMRDALGSKLAITSDFITGFCGETEDEHRDTLDLIEKVNYHFIYVFQYSMREKTFAYHNMKDDVEQEIKIKRLEEIRDLSRSIGEQINRALIGSEQVVLVEGESRRSKDYWQGRADNNVKVIIPKSRARIIPNTISAEANEGLDIAGDFSIVSQDIKPGDYVVCRILEANSQTMKGEAKYITLLEDYRINNEMAVSTITI